MIGKSIGPYQILAELGRGGMGEVYRAHDTALNRDVALKVLPAEFASDAGRLARFTREAQTLAALNHPNIAHIYGIESNALVMELVEGDDLSAIIARHGRSAPAAGAPSESATLRQAQGRPEHSRGTSRGATASGGGAPRAIDIDDALRIAKQIADALEAAHEQGIIHRDLKPANIKVRPDGVVKVLDFGLAKALDPGSKDPGLQGTDSPTLTSPAMTQAGMILGTAAYMAPEQARGRIVDRRADIWAFGVVVFEMLTGRRVFPGEDVTDTIVSVVSKEPDWAALPPETPAALRRLLTRCLKKDPKARLRDIGEARVQIEELLSDAPEQVSVVSNVSAAIPAPMATPASSRPLIWLLAASTLALAITSVLLWAPWRTNATLQLAFQQVTDAAGLESEPSISPDGVSVAYTKTVGTSSDIYVQRIGGRNAVLVAGDPARLEGGAAFSPDGASIAFHDRTGNGGVFVGGATGETIRRLTDFGFHPAWSPNGQQIAFSTEWIRDVLSRSTMSTLWIVDVKGGGAPRQVLKDDAVQPVWSPSGRRIAYWGAFGGQRDIKTVSADGGVPTSVTDDEAVDWDPAWSADGRWLYFASDRGGSMNLWRVAIDDVTGAVRGAPEAITAGVSAADQPTISQDGSRLAFRSLESSVNPIAIPFDPATDKAGAWRTLLDRTGHLDPSDVLGEWLAISNVGDRHEDLFVMRTDGTDLRRVTDDAFRDRRPRWSPDGKELAFDSNRNGRYQVWAIKPDGSGLRLVMSLPESDNGNLAFGAYSPDGARMVGTVSGVARSFLFDAKRNPSEQQPESLSVTLPDGSWIVPTAWSPDGRRLAGPVRRSTGGSAGLAVYDIAARVARLVGDYPVGSVAWLGQDTHRVVVNAGPDLWLVDVDTGQRKQLVKDLGRGSGVAVSRDGKTIYASIGRLQSDVWVVDLKAR